MKVLKSEWRGNWRRKRGYKGYSALDDMGGKSSAADRNQGSVEDSVDVKEQVSGHNKVSDSGTVFSDECQDRLFRVEDESWWFQYRAQIITKMMGRYFKKGRQTVDIGGGNGYTTSVAARKGFQMLLMEPSEEACRNGRKRGVEADCAMMAEDYPKDCSLGQALLLDVLEHIEDDGGFLRLLNRKMENGGVLLITVPAFMCLWSSEDDYAGHFRRYRINPLCKLLEAYGFDVCYRSYFMGFLFLPILVVRVLLEKVGI